MVAGAKASVSRIVIVRAIFLFKFSWLKAVVSLTKTMVNNANFHGGKAYANGTEEDADCSEAANSKSFEARFED